MPTIILQSFASEEHPGSKVVVVEESFEVVLGRVFPTGTIESTVEEHRGNRIYHLVDGGRRCLIYPDNVFYIEEV